MKMKMFQAKLGRGMENLFLVKLVHLYLDKEMTWVKINAKKGGRGFRRDILRFKFYVSFRNESCA